MTGDGRRLWGRRPQPPCELLALDSRALDGRAGHHEALALAGVLALAGRRCGLAGALTFAGIGAGAGDLGLGGGREGAHGEDGGRGGGQGALGHDNLPQWRSNALMPLLPVYARGGGADQRRRSRFGENKGGAAIVRGARCSARGGLLHNLATLGGALL